MRRCGVVVGDGLHWHLDGSLVACSICGAAHTACPGSLPAPLHILDLEVLPVAENTWTADRRLYLNKDGKAVEADDPARVSLLVAEGGAIELERAQQLGLVEVVPAEVKAITPKTNKARAKAPENK